MRLRLVFLFVLSMLCGTSFAFLVGLVWFPLKPQSLHKEVPCSQVLVAKRDIPSGAKLSAEMLEFRFVPVESVPVGSTTDYLALYGRKTLYPISQGSPLSDLDLACSPSENEEDGIPAGMKVVSIKIDRVQGVRVEGIPSFSSDLQWISPENLAKTIQVNDRVDLLLIETAQKTEANFSNGNTDSQSQGFVFTRNPPKTLISGLEVYSTSSLNTTEKKNAETSISVLMSKDQLQLAKNAAKEGRLQIVLHSKEEKVDTNLSAQLALSGGLIADQVPDNSVAERSQNNSQFAANTERTGTSGYGNGDYPNFLETVPNRSSGNPTGENPYALLQWGNRLPGSGPTGRNRGILPVSAEQVLPPLDWERIRENEKQREMQRRREFGIQSIGGEGNRFALNQRNTRKRPENADAATKTVEPVSRPEVYIIGVGSGREKSEGSSEARSESTTKVRGNQKSVVEVYSFAPKKKKKTDLFPKYTLPDMSENTPSGPEHIAANR